MLANKRGRSFCLARAKTVDIIQRQTRIACVFTQLSRPAVFVAVYLALYFKGVGTLPTVNDGIQIYNLLVGINHKERFVPFREDRLMIDVFWQIWISIQGKL